MKPYNTCLQDGWLVAADFPIPTAAHDFAWGRPFIGCNALRCADCGAAVRSAVGLAPGPDPLAPSMLHAIPDWAAIAGGRALVHWPSARLYACRCAVHVQEAYFRSIADPDGDYELEPLPSGWACGGHPKLAVPTDLDGVAISDATDFDALVLASLGGRSFGTPPEFTSRYSACEVERLYSLLTHTSLAADVARAVASTLRHADPAIRAASAEFFTDCPGAPGAADALVRAATVDAASWRGIPHPGAARRTMAMPLGEALSVQLVTARGGLDSGLLRAARDVVAWPGRSAPALLDALAATDQDWLADHASDVLAETPDPDVFEDLLYVLNQALGAGVEAPALAMWKVGAVDRGTFSTLVEVLVSEPTRGRILQAI